MLFFLGYSFVAGVVGARGYEWVATGNGLLHTYLRSVLFGSGAFVAVCLFPIAAKWILVSRWKPREFPLWGLTYLRFWLVKVLLHANPMILFVGNSLYALQLRALGVRIGKGVTILSPSVPVCTDLITIGAGTVIRKDSFFLGCRAHSGRIHTGRVTLGRDVLIGLRGGPGGTEDRRSCDAHGDAPRRRAQRPPLPRRSWRAGPARSWCWRGRRAGPGAQR